MMLLIYEPAAECWGSQQAASPQDAPCWGICCASQETAACYVPYVVHSGHCLEDGTMERRGLVWAAEKWTSDPSSVPASAGDKRFSGP